MCEPGHGDMMGQRKHSAQQGLQNNNGARNIELPATTVGVLWEPLCCEGNLYNGRNLRSVHRMWIWPFAHTH